MAALFLPLCFLAGCSSPDADGSAEEALEVSDNMAEETDTQAEPEVAQEEEATKEEEASAPSADELRAKLNISEDYRSSFVHGDKGAAYQKYIVLHDTEGEGSASSVVNSWDNSGNLIAAHFVINKDGSIVQCVPMDKIAHHAGNGNTGNNATYGVSEDGRDDQRGRKTQGSSLSDYGMNGYSIGIEMVHVGGSGSYPTAQLEALDGLIAYIDAYYGGNAGTIIDHKMWRAGNSDTSAEFANYLANYRDHRSYK